MSLIAHTAKKKMAGMLQKLLGKLTDAPVGTGQTAAGKGASASPAHSGERPSTLPQKTAVHANGRLVEMPLQPIIAGLPLELQPRLRQPDAGARTICVPLEKILAQLASGAVKIPFGELRQAAPELFTGGADRDQVLVSIPLAEVLTRLNPALIMRRREQKLVEVPADVRSPFDRNGQGLVFSVGPTVPEAAPPPAPRHTKPAAPAKAASAAMPSPLAAATR